MVLTEMDVFKKCIACKSTQEKLGSNILKLSNPKSKEDSKNMLKLYYKVWSGLTKFIRSQVNQQKCVYFSLLGSFTSVAMIDGTQSPEDKNQCCYIPDVTFLDLGKLKSSDNKHNRNPYADSKLAKSNISPSSIASVCNTTSDAVSFILKDIIQRCIKLIKEGVNIRLNMKVGFINLSIGKVVFDQSGYSNVEDYSTQSMNRLINRRINGGSADMKDFSMKTSVKTPGSAASMYSSRIKFAHSSNPNPQGSEYQHPRFNKTMYDTFMGKDSGLHSRENSVKHNHKLPFPFVSGMIGGHSYTKPGKRVFFNKRLNDKEVLQHQLEQIDYNKLKVKTDQENERSQDNELLKNIKENINKDEFKKRQFNEIFKVHYKQYNDNKRVENENFKKYQLEAKNGEKYNFFPYTHGDEIEKKRIEQKELLTEELRAKSLHSQNLSNTFYNNRINSESSPRTHGRFNNSFTNGMFAGGSPGQTMSSDIMGMKSLNGKVPVKYVTGYPAFLTPFKQYPYRRLNDAHVENAMQSAIKRFEDGIKSKEQEKMDDADRFKRQLEENNHYMEELEIKKKKAQIENKRMLLEQMKIENFRRLKDSLHDKEKVNTNFGPEENEKTLMEHREFLQKNIGNIKEELEKQMKDKYQLKENERAQERMEDLENLATSKLMMLQEHEEFYNKDKLSKNLFKEAWKEQMKMKEISKKTESIFKN